MVSLHVQNMKKNNIVKYLENNFTAREKYIEIDILIFHLYLVKIKQQKEEKNKKNSKLLKIFSRKN